MIFHDSLKRNKLPTKKNQKTRKMKKTFSTLAICSATVASLIMSLMVFPLKALAQNDAGSQVTIIDRVLAWWPFIIGLAIVLLLILWYQNIRLRRKAGTSGRRSRGFNIFIILGMIIVFVVVLLALPWFLERTSNNGAEQETELVIAPENRREMTLQVEGMTCTGCENLIQRRVSEVAGVESVSADHQQKTTTVVFDSSRTKVQDIVSAIEAAGYQVPDVPEE